MNNNIEAIYGLSPMQKGMLYQNQVDKNSSSYHIQNLFWMQHEADSKHIRTALELLTQKHEALRTAFVIPQASGEPKQVVLKNRSIDFVQIYMPDSSQEAAEEAAMKEDLAQPFNLQNDSLLRVRMVSVNEKCHLFLFSIHHIIMDGWCMSILFKEFFELYKSLENGCAPDIIKRNFGAQQDFQYKDYIDWISSQDREQSLVYWKALLKDYSGKGEILPRKSPMPSEKQVEYVTIQMCQTETSRLKENAKAQGVTLNVMAEAAWGITLQKYNFTNDVVFGKVVSGRNLPLKNISEKIGLFINAVPLRVRCSSKDSLSTLVKELYDQGVQSSAYEHCLLADVQNCAMQGSDLIRTMFVFENYYVDEKKTAELMQTYHVHFGPGREQTHYPVSISFSVENDQLIFRLLFDPNLFMVDEIEVLGECVRKALIELSGDLSRTTDRLDIISQREKDKILHVFNSPPKTSEASKTIVELFEAQTEKTPEAVAVVCQNERVTYAQLNEMANSVAHSLIVRGVEQEDYIAILCERNIRAIACIYGILKAGAAYVPLDPSWPKARLEYILEDCQAKFCISELPEKFEKANVIALSDSSLWGRALNNPGLPLRADMLAYCIYTSGTTGKPKGVMVEHKGVHSLKQYFEHSLGISSKDHILQFANFSFDASVWEMNMALLLGAQMVIASDEARSDNEQFLQLVHREQVSVATLPTVFYNHIEGFEPRLIITAGSESSRDIVCKAANSSTYINAYGPTETTVAATHWKYDGSSPIPNRIPIGKPIRNMQVYIQNGNALCGIGVPGELCVSGVGVARGYLNNAQLNDQKFCRNLYGSGKMYRTGDLAMWQEDGNIEYLGRMDDQVKVRGFRIELGDIENAFQELEYISDAVTLAIKDHADDTSLFAYYVADTQVEPSKIKSDLEKKLPAYMIPSSMLQIKAIPVTGNGKPDKKKLCQLEIAKEDAYVAPKNKQEKILCGLMAEILNLQRVGAEDDFFERGGNSLTAIKLMTVAHNAGCNITIADINNLHTARKMAQRLRETSTDMKETPIRENMRYCCKNIPEVSQVVEKAMGIFEAQIQEGKVECTCDLSPMQKLSLEQDMLMSAHVIAFNEELHISRFAQALKSVIKRQDQMRCKIQYKENTPQLVMLQTPETLELPIIDLTGLDGNERRTAENLLENLLLKQDRWSNQTLENRLLYQIYVVKYSEANWKVYMPFCHLIFDGRSADVLQEQLYCLYQRIDRESQMPLPPAFQTFIDIIRQGPIGATEDELMQWFDLPEMERSISALPTLKLDNFENCFISLNAPIDLDEMDVEEMYYIAFHLFETMFAHSFQTRHVPAFVLYAGRKHRGVDFSNKVGEFLDIIPVTTSYERETDYEHLNALFHYVEKHQICFAAFFYDEGIRARYPRIANIFDQIKNRISYFPVFNFLGYTERSYQEKKEEIHLSDKTRSIVDVSYNRGEITLSGFCPKGQSKQLSSMLESVFTAWTKKSRRLP